MASKKNQPNQKTPLEDATRQRAVSRFLVRQWPVYRMAAALDCSQELIQKDIDFIISDARKRNSQEYDELLHRQVLALDYIQDQCVEAWEESKLDEKQDIVIEKEGEKEGESYSETVTKKVRSGRGPKSQYLEAMLRAIEIKSKLLGLDNEENRSGRDDAPVVPVVIRSREELRLYREMEEHHRVKLITDEQAEQWDFLDIQSPPKEGVVLPADKDDA